MTMSITFPVSLVRCQDCSHESEFPYIIRMTYGLITYTTIDGVSTLYLDCDTEVYSDIRMIMQGLGQRKLIEDPENVHRIQWIAGNCSDFDSSLLVGYVCPKCRGRDCRKIQFEVGEVSVRRLTYEAFSALPGQQQIDKIRAGCEDWRALRNTPSRASHE